MTLRHAIVSKPCHCPRIFVDTPAREILLTIVHSTAQASDHTGGRDGGQNTKLSNGRQRSQPHQYCPERRSRRHDPVVAKGNLKSAYLARSRPLSGIICYQSMLDVRDPRRVREVSLVAGVELFDKHGGTKS